MRRFDRLQQILALDPDRDHYEIFRLLLVYEFPWDITKALELALFRTYAVPSIGGLLDRTGELTQRPQKRYDDTRLILFEIFYWGANSDRGLRALDQLNAIHSRFRISNDDYLYTLATFVVTPVRWIEQFGWRRLHPNEVRALTNSMRYLGQGMHISDIPETYDEFAKLLNDYERDQFAVDHGGRRVADATLKLFTSWYPRPIAPVLKHAAKAAMDPPLLAALRYPKPSATARKIAHWALYVRAQLLRVGPTRPDSRPVLPVSLSYPNGYEIEELGPRSFHREQR
ncbi:DUF2236 domain-containing protein [Saccharopolyspora terrae]|uniref:DUF2236 domain-containing protein n=1 Tax=Saccharopolyspora terrae TaxID=2530384 RepID=A0A4R4VD69_9PSEU|nr:oxygenase MpaB family protein [Saccharopolyspora terrae]TDC99943.1 DUF2236 domain-containing protein [Saccharopolyspora terrae]